MTRPGVYGCLAALFDYPRSDYPMRVREAHERLATAYPAAAERLAAFRDVLPENDGSFSESDHHEVQEIFTRSFDVQSITTLSVGYVMFGDDYKRGELLVNLSREHRDAGVDCGTELPDHLPNVLRLLEKWEDGETAEEFVREILRPAVDRMIQEFGPERMTERNELYRKHYKTLIDSSARRATMFRDALGAVLAVVTEDFPGEALVRPEIDNDFLRSIGRELDIEADEGRPAPAGKML